MIQAIDAWQCTCEKCGHAWQAKAVVPRLCPKCKTVKWNDVSVSERVLSSKDSKASTSINKPLRNDATSIESTHDLANDPAEMVHDLDYAKNESYDYAE